MKLPGSMNVELYPSAVLVLVYSGAFGVGFRSTFPNCQPRILHRLGSRAF